MRALAALVFVCAALQRKQLRAGLVTEAGSMLVEKLQPLFETQYEQAVPAQPELWAEISELCTEQACKR